MAEIFFLLFLIVKILGPSIIYLDAARNKIGRVKGVKSFWNIPAGWWGVCSVGILILALPGYLIKRKELIARAQEHPQESNYKIIKAILLLLAVLALTFRTAITAQS